MKPIGHVQPVNHLTMSQGGIIPITSISKNLAIPLKISISIHSKRFVLVNLRGTLKDITTGMKSETQVQILDEAVCISLYANTLGKGMNPSVLA